jgi:hypothetical protein
MNDTWESDIASLLTDLAEVQSALLALLAEKRHLLATSDHQALSVMSGREQQLVDRLQACHAQRQQLLARAQAEGLPADSISSLSAQLAPEGRKRTQASIRQAAERSRLLQHQCLTNWVLVQRTLLHLSQLIEIIATGGRLKPTYSNSADRHSPQGGAMVGGALVDRAA